eukprot:TRINITY_DN4236_c1_g1_i2.p2 TRINITY_DN4236_c1_g1~~TRINITY_DN4236_c1_g1_i2.p2  ORF type:complete len:280 (+),score=39.46 TRINITY_DN4236_c1_g1_i2:286-1125(+)
MLAISRGIGTVLRGVGSSLDALGAGLQGDLAPREALMPVVNRLTIQGVTPSVSKLAFVAPNAAVMGDVTIGPHSSIWYGATLRGDVNSISVGHTTNIQDRAVVHVAKHNPEGRAAPTIIGNQVTIGHGAIIHACTIEDQVLIGMGAKVLDGAVVRSGSIVAAGSLVVPNTEVPSGQVWAGCPARYFRDLTEGEGLFLSHSAQNYANLAMQHAEENTKVFLAVLDDDRKVEDASNRDPNFDLELGIKRNTFTREVMATPDAKTTAQGYQNRLLSDAVWVI